MVSMASVQGLLTGMVVRGLRRREEMVAPRKGSSFTEWERVRVSGETGGGFSEVKFGVGGSKSLAASQSSSTNCTVLLEG
jgi:hypothetical protein